MEDPTSTPGPMLGGAELQAALRVLDLFNAKVERLERSEFGKFLDEKVLGYSVTMLSSGSFQIELRAADEDVIDGFLLTLRMFIQPNDLINVGKIATIYRRLPIDAGLRDEVGSHHRRWKRYLNEDASLIEGEKHFSRREVLDFVMYGDRAHLDLEHRAMLEPWLENASLKGMVETAFGETIEGLMEILRLLKKANEQVLTTLRSSR